MEKFTLAELAGRFKAAMMSAIAVDHPVGQGVTTLVLSALAFQARSLVVPILALLALMVVDFITGMRAARFRGEEISSERYFVGLEKKVYLLVLVGVGLVIDLLIVYTTQVFDLAVNLSVAVAVTVCLWLVVNEIISILENVQDIGVKFPKWLLPLAQNIRKRVESAAPTNSKEDEYHE